MSHSQTDINRGEATVAADPFGLARFLTAQAGVFDQAIEEIHAGRKRGHWMWYVFPQLRGLSHSSVAQFYGISGVKEALAYLQHPVLGPRLEVAAAAVDTSPAPSLNALFGSPDDLKFCSSMTLFAIANPDGPYQAALESWCGESDRRTIELLRGGLP